MAGKTVTRVYAVRSNESGHLLAFVESPTKQQALAHMAKMSFGVDVATQKELIEGTKAGVRLDVAGVDNEPPPAEQTKLPLCDSDATISIASGQVTD